MPTLRQVLLLSVTLGAVVACGGEGSADAVPVAQAAEVTGTRVTVRDTSVVATIDASGIAEPLRQSTLSTRLMGTVTQVLVQEGDRVSAGQVLVRLDARELEAKRLQVQGAIAGAEAVHNEARLQAERFRKLYADSAAPKAQLDAVEAGLERARAGVQAARAGEAELLAVTDYAVVRAPFAGVVTRRFVDPGALAAPGAPLVDVQDQRSLRVSVSASPSSIGRLSRGATVDVVIEGVATRGTIEGIVPASMGSMLTVNAVVPNQQGQLFAGGAATIRLPQGPRAMLLVPAAAIRREGDLTGVLVVDGTSTRTRWVRLGATYGDKVEVVSGLRAGDTIVVPVSGAKE
jgi:RND family efflux transporter MFP subunit